MDKNAIKKYAVWARNELIARVSQKAQQYGITAEGYGDKNADSVNGVLLSATEKKQRQALIVKIDAEGFEQVMEEVAYTWFNRFTALRFMEVNNYLPSHTRVFTNEANEFKPQILADAISLEIEGLDMDKVFELKNANKDEELYKYLLIVQCNALSSILPGIFPKISDYTELLLPDYLLRVGSAVEQMISIIPEDNWTDQVQIIGWLYQYYNTEPKAKVFGKGASEKISKEEVPAATQLFTPDWVVRYLVDNSLGKIWDEGHASQEFLSKMYYYIPEPEQNNGTLEKNKVIKIEYSKLKPEEINCIDPCCGSGHILCYLFDVLMNVYEDYGYSPKEAVGLIIEKNIHGLDIDVRAAQLAYFSIMMKARQYDRRFFSRKDENGNLVIPQPKIHCIVDSNGLKPDALKYLGEGLSAQERAQATSMAQKLISEFKDAREYGSAINVSSANWELLKKFARYRNEYSGQQTLDITGEQELAERLRKLIELGEILSDKYYVVCTNPPYMSSSGMDAMLANFVKKNYPDSKADMFAVFIEKCNQLCRKNGMQAMITQHAWMFLSSYEKLRSKIQCYDIVNMAHLGPRAFEEIAGEVVQTTSFVIRKSKVEGYIAEYRRLVDYPSQKAKEEAFLSGVNRYCVTNDNFEKIPGAPIAYWVSDSMIEDFAKGVPFANVGFPKVGMQTSNNDKFLRLWYEVNSEEFYSDSKKWIKYVKGGSYRKWYGNLEYVVWYNSTPSFILQQKNARVLPESELTVLKGTWTDLATSRFSSRVAPIDSFHDISGHCFYPSDENYYYLLAYTNSCVFQEIIDLLNSSLHYQVGDVARTPVIIEKKEEIIKLAKRCVELSKNDWDSFEFSWDFAVHPLIRGVGSIKEAFDSWEEECNNRFYELKKCEEEINRLFIEIYHLDGELTASVDEKDVSVRKADINRDIKSLISYAVGCMFGRYSLDEQGIVFAGGEFSESKYSKFMPDMDNIIPICTDDYFNDDILGLFIKFITVVYGRENLEENLTYIANALGDKGSARDIIRSYFLNDFYKDHCSVYSVNGSGRRPIYWLFESGKKNGFRCLCYMHRYKPDTIARIRTDYVHEQQSRYRTAISDLEQRVNSASAGERIKLGKQLKDIQEQADELRVYEEKIHHLADQMISINLDDGVKENYAKFQDVLAKIK